MRVTPAEALPRLWKYECYISSVDLKSSGVEAYPIVTRELRQVVGENLRRLRGERGLSQEAFAEKAGIHRTYVGGIERGTRNVTLETLERIAAAFGIEPADLLK